MTRDEASKRAQQAALLGDNELTLIGNGPGATGGHGWTMSQGRCFKCVRCGYFMRDDPNTYDKCFCGLMFKDADAGRFGSDLGDDAIEVYGATPR